MDEIQQTLVKASQIRSLKHAKIDAKLKKGGNMITKLFGVGGGTSASSIKTEQSLQMQQEEMKKDLELQMYEYFKLVNSSQPFRSRYAYQMKELISKLENSMRINV